MKKRFNKEKNTKLGSVQQQGESLHQDFYFVGKGGEVSALKPIIEKHEGINLSVEKKHHKKHNATHHRKVVSQNLKGGQTSPIINKISNVIEEVGKSSSSNHKNKRHKVHHRKKHKTVKHKKQSVKHHVKHHHKSKPKIHHKRHNVTHHRKVVSQTLKGGGQNPPIINKISNVIEEVNVSSPSKHRKKHKTVKHKKQSVKHHVKHHHKSKPKIHHKRHNVTHHHKLSHKTKKIHHKKSNKKNLVECPPSTVISDENQPTIIGIIERD